MAFLEMLNYCIKCRLQVIFAITMLCALLLLLSVYNTAVISTAPLAQKVYASAEETQSSEELVQRHNRMLQNTNYQDLHQHPDSVSPMETHSDSYELPDGDAPDSNLYLDDYDNDEDSGLSGSTVGVEHPSGGYYDAYKTNPLHGSNATKRLPDAIIIGVKKSGTRALLQFLRIHPRVRATGPEPHFFDRNYHRGLDWYRDHMPSSMPGQIIIEKTPSYFVTREVPKRVYNMSKSIKLLVIVRDPVIRAISDYTQAASKRPGMKSFEEMALLDNRTGLVNSSWGAVRIGVYPKHLDRWLKYFPLRQFHFVSGERLIDDPAGEMARVQDFLGLDQVINQKHFYINQTRGFPCLIKPEENGIPRCLGKTKGRHHPQVNQHVIQRLRTFFKPFNFKFYQMVGQDFKWPT